MSGVQQTIIPQNYGQERKENFEAPHHHLTKDQRDAVIQLAEGAHGHSHHTISGQGESGLLAGDHAAHSQHAHHSHGATDELSRGHTLGTDQSAHSTHPIADIYTGNQPTTASGGVIDQPYGSSHGSSNLGQRSGSAGLGAAGAAGLAGVGAAAAGHGHNTTDNSYLPSHQSGNLSGAGAGSLNQSNLGQSNLGGSNTLGRDNLGQTGSSGLSGQHPGDSGKHISTGSALGAGAGAAGLGAAGYSATHGSHSNQPAPGSISGTDVRQKSSTAPNVPAGSLEEKLRNEVHQRAHEAGTNASGFGA